MIILLKDYINEAATTHEKELNNNRMIAVIIILQCALRKYKINIIQYGETLS